MNLFDTVRPIIQHLIEQVYSVDAVGEGSKSFKYWEVDTASTFEESATRERSFAIYPSRDGEGLVKLLVGAGSVDYNMNLQISICYNNDDNATLYALNDYELIRSQINKSDVSALDGYQFTFFDGFSWQDSAEDDAKFRYLIMKSTLAI